MSFTIYKGVSPEKIPTRARYNGVKEFTNQPPSYGMRRTKGIYLPELNEIAFGMISGVNVSSGLGANPWTKPISESTFYNVGSYGSFICETGIAGKYVIAGITSGDSKKSGLKVTTDSFTTVGTTLYENQSPTDYARAGGLEYMKETGEILFLKQRTDQGYDFKTFAIVIDPSTMTTISKVYLPNNFTVGKNLFSTGSNGLCVAVSDIAYKTKIAISTDYGRTWAINAHQVVSSALSVYADGDTILINAYTANGYVFHVSNDRGVSWTEVSTNVSWCSGIGKLGDAYVATYEDTYLIISYDGGLTWKRDPLMVEDATSPITRIIEGPDNKIFIVGDYYVLNYSAYGS